MVESFNPEEWLKILLQISKADENAREKLLDRMKEELAVTVSEAKESVEKDMDVARGEGYKRGKRDGIEQCLEVLGLMKVGNENIRSASTSDLQQNLIIDACEQLLKNLLSNSNPCTSNVETSEI